MIYSNTNKIDGLFDRYAVIDLLACVSEVNPAKYSKLCVDYVTNPNNNPLRINNSDGCLFINAPCEVDYLHNENFHNGRYIKFRKSDLKGVKIGDEIDVQLIVPVIRPDYEPTDDELSSIAEEERELTWYDARRVFEMTHIHYTKITVNTLAVLIGNNSTKLGLVSMCGVDTEDYDSIRELPNKFSVRGEYEFIRKN